MCSIPTVDATTNQQMRTGGMPRHHGAQLDQLERGTVPVALGTMGYHADIVTQKRAYFNGSKLAAREAKVNSPGSAPNTGETRSSGSSNNKTSSASAGHQHVAAPPAGVGAAAPSAPLALPSTSTATHSQAIVVVDSPKVASSKARAQSQLLGKGFIAQNIDFDAIADSSVGGNGLPRPYGRFIAHREGNGLSMWQRLPNARHDPMAQHFGPPPITEPLPSERNVTHMNILNKNFTGRNLKVEKPIKSTTSMRADKITNLPKSLLDTDPDARARPFNPPLGRDYYANRSFNRGEGRFNLPAASFLCKRPGNTPTNVRVDCGQESVHDHLISRLPEPELEWRASSADEASLPLYHGSIVRADGSTEPLRRPAANRHKIIHPALAEVIQLRLNAPGDPLPPIPARATLDVGGEGGSTFLTQ